MENPPEDTVELIFSTPADFEILKLEETKELLESKKFCDAKME